MVRLNHSVNDIDDINNKNVFINHSVKILARNMNTNTTKPLKKELVNDKNDRNDKNVFVSHSVNNFANDFVNDIDDINDKNVFVSHSVNDFANDFVNDIDDIKDKNVFVNRFVNDFANDFVTTKVNTKSRNDNGNGKHSTKRTKSIENKSVVLSGVYLQPFWGYSYMEMVFNKGRKTSFDKSSAAALSSSGGGGAP